MKMSTRVLLLALGAASLGAVAGLPASADDNTPVTNGTGNCSTARDGAPNKRCLTKPREGQKTGFDQYADEQARLHAGRIKTFAGSGVNNSGHPYQVNSYSDGSGDIRTTDPKTSITTYSVRNADGSISSFTSRPGGGSGGRTSSR